MFFLKKDLNRCNVCLYCHAEFGEPFCDRLSSKHNIRENKSSGCADHKLTHLATNLAIIMNKYPLHILTFLTILKLVLCTSRRRKLPYYDLGIDLLPQTKRNLFHLLTVDKGNYKKILFHLLTVDNLRAN